MLPAWRNEGTRHSMQYSVKRLRALALAVLATGLSASFARATSATGTIAVTATTVASVSLTFVTDGAGITLGSSGTSAATVAFGSVQAYGGTVPSGVTRTVNGTTNWSLSTPIDVVVQVANQTSSNYTLTAALQTADSTNTWQLGATSLSTTAATLTSTGAYGSTAYTYKLTIPFSAAAGAISNTINFTATAN
jgi:hypothetical protein